MNLSDDSNEIIGINFDRVNEFESSPEEPEQSANSLFHFVEKYDYLENILKKKKMPFWYVKENVQYLGIKNINYLLVPMKCFCDINLHKIKLHMNYYGYYGIGFSKSWGIQKGIQPVQYTNKKSLLVAQYKKSFEAAMIDDSSVNDEIKNYLSTHIMFMKPLIGEQKDGSGENHNKYFSDESEWRFVFDTSNIEECEQFYLADEFTTAYELNKSITNKLDLGIDFIYSDIKYLIVKTKTDFQMLLNLLKEYVDDEQELFNLISKIIVWDESRSDF